MSDVSGKSVRVSIHRQGCSLVRHLSQPGQPPDGLSHPPLLGISARLQSSLAALTRSSSSGFLRSSLWTAMTSMLPTPPPLCEVKADVKAETLRPELPADEMDCEDELADGSCTMILAFWQTRSTASAEPNDGRLTGDVADRDDADAAGASREAVA